jgi:hypothetical protein
LGARGNSAKKKAGFNAGLNLCIISNLEQQFQAKQQPPACNTVGGEITSESQTTVVIELGVLE